MEAKPPMIEVQTPSDISVLLLFSAPDFKYRMPYVLRVRNIMHRKLTLVRYKHSNGLLKTDKIFKILNCLHFCIATCNK